MELNRVNLSIDKLSIPFSSSIEILVDSKGQVYIKNIDMDYNTEASIRYLELDRVCKYI